MVFRRSIVACLLALSSLHVLPAQNLVLNPSFEDYSACPISISLLGNALNWKVPTMGTSDYFNACSPPVGYYYAVSVPINFGGFQPAHTGDAYAGIHTNSDAPYISYREYIQGELSDSLIAGNVYEVSFFTNVANWSPNITDGIGFTLTPHDFYEYDFTPLEGYGYDYTLVDSQWVSDSVNWVRVSADYTALGGERFITIGNFRHDTNIVTLPFNPTGAMGGGYLYIDDVSVEIKTPCPESPLEDFYALCPDGGATVNAFTPEATSYLWDDSSTSHINSYAQPGIHWVEMSNADCSLRDTFEIVTSIAPILERAPDTAMCPGEQIDLIAPQGHGPYHWDTERILGFNFPGRKLTAYAAGKYRVNYSKDGCPYQMEFFIRFKPPPPLDLGPDTLLCPGEKLQISAQHDLIRDYIWNDGTSDTSIVVGQGGSYGVTVTGKNDCISEDRIKVNYVARPSLGPDRPFCPQRTIELNAFQPGGTYLWSNGSTDPMIEVNASGEYWVEVRSYRCVQYAEVNVWKDWGECNCPVFSPSAFSPNGDGLNDEFLPFIDCMTYGFHLRIFDRWGKIIFESRDPDRSWNGTFAGQPCQEGMFSYQLSFFGIHDQKKQSMIGSILLLR